MRLAVSVLLLILAANTHCVAQQSGAATPVPHGLYELYSWQQSNGRWNFCLLPSPSGMNIPAEAVFDERMRLHDVTSLKRKISELPADSEILWMDQLSGTGQKANGSDKLACPPRKIVDQIEKHAEKYHIKVNLEFCGSHAALSGVRKSVQG
jgi:hypothetical protein